MIIVQLISIRCIVTIAGTSEQLRQCHIDTAEHRGGRRKEGRRQGSDMHGFTPRWTVEEAMAEQWSHHPQPLRPPVRGVREAKVRTPATPAALSLTNLPRSCSDLQAAVLRPPRSSGGPQSSTEAGCRRPRTRGWRSRSPASRRTRGGAAPGLPSRSAGEPAC